MPPQLQERDRQSSHFLTWNDLVAVYPGTATGTQGWTRRTSGVGSGSRELRNPGGCSLVPPMTAPEVVAEENQTGQRWGLAAVVGAVIVSVIKF